MREDRDLAELYRAAIDGVPSTGTVDPAGARAAARRRQWRRSSAALGVLGAVAVAVAGALLLSPYVEGGETIAAPPPIPSAQPAMTAAPAEAHPGSTVTLYFAAGVTRGLGFTLGATQPDTPGPGKSQGQTADRVDYYLSAGRNGAEPSGRAAWTPAYATADVAWPPDKVEGNGGDKVRIPEPAAPGEYRLCTAAVAPTFCTTLTIT